MVSKKRLALFIVGGGVGVYALIMAMINIVKLAVIPSANGDTILVIMFYITWAAICAWGIKLINKVLISKGE